MDFSVFCPISSKNTGGCDRSAQDRLLKAQDAASEYYILPTEISPGKLQANLKIHKKNYAFRKIVNVRQHPTDKLAEYVE